MEFKLQNSIELIHRIFACQIVKQAPLNEQLSNRNTYVILVATNVAYVLLAQLQ